MRNHPFTERLFLQNLNLFGKRLCFMFVFYMLSIYLLYNLNLSCDCYSNSLKNRGTTIVVIYNLCEEMALRKFWKLCSRKIYARLKTRSNSNCNRFISQVKGGCCVENWVTSSVYCSRRIRKALGYLLL